MLYLHRGGYQVLKSLWGESGFAGMGSPDRLGQLVNRGVFEQISDGSRLQRPLHQLLFSKTGQRDNLDGRMRLPDSMDGSSAMHLRHHQVHQDHIRLKLGAQAYRFGAVRCLTDQFQVVKRFQKDSQTTPHHVVIIDDHHANRARFSHATPFSLA